MEATILWIVLGVVLGAALGYIINQLPKIEHWPWPVRVSLFAAVVGLSLFVAIKAQPGSSKDGGHNDAGDPTSSPTTGTTSGSDPLEPTEPTSVPPTSAGGPGPSYQLQMGTKTYADLDTGKTSTTGGRDYEINLDFTGTRLFHRADENDSTATFLSQYRLVGIDDHDPAGCGQSGRLENEGFQAVSDLRDSNLCVSTSAGRWAILVLTAQPGTSIFTIEGNSYDVYLS